MTPSSAEQDKYDVISYDLYLQPSMTATSITSATMTMRARSLVASLSSVVLDLDRNSAGITVGRVDQGDPSTPSITPTYNDASYLMTIPLATPVALNQEFTIRVAYSGSPRTGSFPYRMTQPYTRTTHNSTPVVYTASQPVGARRWWPCKDWPEDKADTVITRINVPATAPNGNSYEVVSNGNLTGVETVGSTRTWIHQSTRPITTYLVSFSVTDYVYSTATYTALNGVTTMPIRHAIYRENNTSAREANGAAGTLQVMNFFREIFGEYPFLNEKYGTATWNISFGIEHQTCTGMPGAAQYGVSESVGNGLTRRNMHELAHMWYGDSVTYRTFDHVWLGEAFATYAEALWAEHLGGTSALHSYVNAWSWTETTPIVSSSGINYTGSVVYRRGAWVLHMLRHVIGDTAFFNTLRNFSSTFKDATAISSDFENIAEAASGQNLDAFFRQWLYRPNADGATLPVYAFNGNTASSAGNWNLTLQLNQAQTGSVPFTMPLDFKITYVSGSTNVVVVNNAAMSDTQVLSVGASQPLEVDLDPDNWLLNYQNVSINTVGLPPATSGAAYSRSLRASGGTSPYTWSFSGSAPAWLSLSSAGVLSATSPVAGTYSIPVQVTDSTSTPRTRTATLQLVVQGSGIEDALEY